MLDRKCRFSILITLLLFATLLFAETRIQFVNTLEVVPGFKKAMAVLLGMTRLPVVFPGKIPVFSKKPAYYISIEAQPRIDHYTINIDATPDCKGAHYCNIGSLTVSLGGTPQVYYSMDHRQLTVPVQVIHGKKAYFTPSHAMASYWPAQLEWREGKVLYRLIWNLEANVPQKEVLVAMVNLIAKQS